jgi:hypothetical protein
MAQPFRRFSKSSGGRKMETFKQWLNERAYHGSAVPFDEKKFVYDKIGSGEGAQAFGWGFYFAENKSVAASYIQQAHKEEYKYREVAGIEWYEFFNISQDYPKMIIWDFILLHWSKDRIIDYLKKAGLTDGIKYVESLPNELFAPPAGKLYIVEIKANEDEFLKWFDLFEDQTKFVKTVLSSYKNQIERGMNYVTSNIHILEESSGFEIYKGIKESFSIPKENGGLLEGYCHNKPKAASLFLLKNGIKGIIYPDANSRPTQSNPIPKITRNVVIFNPDDVEIVGVENEI